MDVRIHVSGELVAEVEPEQRVENRSDTPIADADDVPDVDTVIAVRRTQP